MAVVATLSKGYDLDYLWRQAGTSAGTEGAGYHLQAAEAGEPPGRWWGPGAEALGFARGQVVEREPYDLLFGHRQAPDGTPLGRPPGGKLKAAEVCAQLLAAEPHATAERKHQLRIEATSRALQSPLYFDLTISLSKSISIFHASLGENARLAHAAGDAAGEAYWAGLVTEVDQMIWDAVYAGFTYFQREAGYTRTGSHNSRVDGRETGQWHEADLAVAQWLQHTSRDGDTQALAITRDISAPLEEARALEGIGQCHIQNDDPGNGADCLRQALAIYQRIGAPHAQRLQEILAHPGQLTNQPDHGPSRPSHRSLRH